MKSTLGKVLQGLGLAVSLLGLFVGVSVGNVRAELIYLALGIILFYAGIYIERGTIKPQ